MSYLIRVWMTATGDAAAQGHTDPAGNPKCKTGLKFVPQNRRRFFSAAGDSSELGPLSGGVNRNGDVEDRLGQVDDSLRKVMYLNCWGQG
ncbi:uncharacterized protein LOC133283897 [Gastrolobium bilobum]|uniref:uncharacterized protein LOC133283897 n=1 Tax=Gastrolobium bilobum TaxID=150636 RepID=UPI002AAFE2C4|nr:uncharacterized protein LOC133283897 [Gastrolobium bilobum]